MRTYALQYYVGWPIGLFFDHAEAFESWLSMAFHKAEISMPDFFRNNYPSCASEHVPSVTHMTVSPEASNTLVTASRVLKITFKNNQVQLYPHSNAVYSVGVM